MSEAVGLGVPAVALPGTARRPVPSSRLGQLWLRWGRRRRSSTARTRRGGRQGGMRRGGGVFCPGAAWIGPCSQMHCGRDVLDADHLGSGGAGRGLARGRTSPPHTPPPTRRRSSVDKATVSVSSFVALPWCSVGRSTVSPARSNVDIVIGIAIRAGYVVGCVGARAERARVGGSVFWWFSVRVVFLISSSLCVMGPGAVVVDANGLRSGGAGTGPLVSWKFVATQNRLVVGPMRTRRRMQKSNVGVATQHRWGWQHRTVGLPDRREPVGGHRNVGVANEIVGVDANTMGGRYEPVGQKQLPMRKVAKKR